jgi:hypothetical protein
MFEKIKKSIFKETPINKMSKPIGKSGTTVSQGYITDDYNGSLQGKNGYTTYDEMFRSDAQVNATVHLCINTILGADWYIEPAVDENGEVTKEYQEQADFIDRALFEDMDLTWEQTLYETLMCLPFGFSVLEIILKLNEDGQIIVKKLSSRKQNTVEKFETMDGKPGITQNVSPTMWDYDKKTNYLVSIPEDKLLIFTHNKQGDNYEGISMLRPAYRNWFIKGELLKFDSVRHEKLAMGAYIGRCPKNTPEEEKENFLADIMRLRVSENSAVLLPGTKEDGWDVEVIDTTKGNGTDIFESIKYHDGQIPKVVLANFIDLGSSDTGSRAMDESKKALFLQALEATAKNIASVYNRKLIRRLVDYNFKTDAYPMLKFKSMEDNDNEKFSTILKSLFDAGAITSDMETEQHIRGMIDLPPKSKEAIEQAEEMRQNLLQPDVMYDDEEDDSTSSESDEVSDSEKDDMEEGDESEFSDYLNLAKHVNNKFIIGLQNECGTSEEYQELKKKGYRLNDYEKKAWRPMTFAERKVNFNSLDKTMKQAKGSLKKSVDDITRKQKEDLIKQIKKAVDNNDPESLGNISIKYKGELAQAITDLQKDMFEVGKKTAATEMGVKVPPTKKEVRGAMRVQNDAIVNDMTTRMENEAKLATSQLINQRGGSITAVNSTTAGVAAGKAMTNVATKATNQLITYGITGSINVGRGSIFDLYPEQIYAVQYSAILDGKTSNRCLSLDGRVVKYKSQDYYNYSPPQHFNCRSIWVEILKEEQFKPDIGKIPKSIPPSTNINTSQNLKKPILNRNSPASKEIKRRRDVEKLMN